MRSPLMFRVPAPWVHVWPESVHPALLAYALHCEVSSVSEVTYNVAATWARLAVSGAVVGSLQSKVSA